VAIALLSATAGYTAGQIGSEDIANDSIRSVDIQDGTIRNQDLSENALRYRGADWSIIDRNVLGNGDSYLRAGPTGAPNGVGSLGLRTGSPDDKAAFGNQADFQGRSLSEIQTVAYSVTEADANAWTRLTASDADRWWLTGAAGTASGCTQASYCTLDEVKEKYPNATLLTAQITKGRDYAFSGAVDGLQVDSTLYDFEPDGVRQVAAP
jgi:hypothetical protein